MYQQHALLLIKSWQRIGLGNYKCTPQRHMLSKLFVKKYGGTWNIKPKKSNYFASLTVPVGHLRQGWLRSVLGGSNEIWADHWQGFGGNHIAYQKRSFQKGIACMRFCGCSIFSERPHPERAARGDEDTCKQKQSSNTVIPIKSIKYPRSTMISNLFVCGHE